MRVNREWVRSQLSKMKEMHRPYQHIYTGHECMIIANVCFYFYLQDNRPWDEGEQRVGEIPTKQNEGDAPAIPRYIYRT